MSWLPGPSLSLSLDEGLQFQLRCLEPKEL